MLVQVRWSSIRRKDNPRWDWARVLYAYLGPDEHEVLYIGKAFRQTVRGRFRYSSKEGLWEDLERERGIRKAIVLVGEVTLPPGKRLTDELVSDIESLLIKRIRPYGNIQSRTSRISRPGLRVLCVGKWPFGQREYRDTG
jgi:hypothetical protein